MNRILLQLVSVICIQALAFADNGGNNPLRFPLADTIPPVLNCPASQTIMLQAGECDTILNYQVTATDDQGQAIVIQLSGPASGSVFPRGASTCVFLATDLAGNTATCAFTFTVEDLDAILTCNDVYWLPLIGANCTGSILPQAVLEGGPYGCWNRFVAEVDKVPPFGGGPWVPADFNASDEGKTYQYRITDMDNGNRCWGNVNVRDVAGPELQCQHLTVSCMEPNLDPVFLRDSLGLAGGVPSASDACGMATPPTFVDIQTDNFNCDSAFSKVVHRRWQTTDDNNNTSTCVQLIRLVRPTLDDVLIPGERQLSCPDNDLSISETGAPYIVHNGRTYNMDEHGLICDITGTYQDFLLNLPCGDRRVRRVWELFDFCTSITKGVLVQDIFLVDNSKPIVSCPGNVLVSVNADTCYGWVNLPDVVLDDECSPVNGFNAFWLENGLTKNLQGFLSTFPGNNLQDYDTLGVMGSAYMPIGTTVMSYVAEDSCGNLGDCTFLLTVADMDNPEARCDTLPKVFLSEEGLAVIGAGIFDNGSTDACTDSLSFKVRFQNITACMFDTLWTDSLRFCCLDQADTVEAILRVYDIPVPSGEVAESYGAGHYTDCALRILVEDLNPPLCVAPQNLIVSCEDFDPTLEDYGIITSATCSVDSIVLEVDYTQFDTVCSRGTIVRIFKVYDEEGNEGGCAQAITVDFREDYFVKFPDDVIVTACDGTGQYGAPELQVNGCGDFEITYTDEIFTVVPDACYKIDRTWKIINRCAYNPSQPLIKVPNPNPSPINNHSSNLIGAIVSKCGTPGAWMPSIVRINPSDPSPTNYCVFYSDSTNGYEYKQIIKVIDSQAPTGTYTVPECSNQNWTTSNNPLFWNETYWWDDTLQQHDLCEEPLELSIVASDLCIGADVDVAFLLFMDLDDNQTQETVVVSTSLGAAGLGWNNVRFNNVGTPNFSGGTSRAFDARPVPANQKMGFALETTVSGNQLTAKVRWNTEEDPNTYFTPELPHGKHRIVWIITDNCSNEKSYEYNFTIKDCKAPTVSCKAQALTLHIGATNTVEVEIADALDYTEDNCTPDSLIALSMRKCGTGSGFPLNAEGNPISSVTFNCDDLGTQCVQIWGRDKAGNLNSCDYQVIIADNSDRCSGSFNGVYGHIRNETGVGIADVSVGLESTSPLQPPFFGNPGLTDSLGYYEIPGSGGLPLSWDVVPERDDNPLNGASTFDLVLISKHILGLEILNSPYKMIAADANRSGSITTFDIVEFRRLILGIYNELPNNTSWRFVDSSFVFPNPQNPFQTGFPEKTPLTGIKPYNFIGMKVGDVNLSAIPNAQAPASERFAGQVYFELQDRLVQEGEELLLPIQAAELLDGCQLTLEAAGLDLLSVIPGDDMREEQFALFPRAMTMAWETGGKAQFILQARAQRTGWLHDMLQVSDRITPAEAYKPGLSAREKQRVALRFEHPEEKLVLYQNQPNPFDQRTNIRFYLPSAGPATLKVLDSHGKLVWSQSGDFSKGTHNIELDLGKISAAGVLYYQIETEQGAAAGKMVRI
ncbi:MAG: HYR domain-containing protein [Saprospiraceae bacterium]|nr:HYR domain-containing protein [Saprospiraceae bacterium]